MMRKKIRSVYLHTPYALFTHPLRLIAHQFASLGSSFLTIYTPPSLGAGPLCSENMRRSWLWTQHNKPNGFHLPLFNICGSTFSKASFSVASAFLSSEDTESFK